MMAPKDIRDEVRESLGLPPPPPAMVPMEGHVCDFPLWSYSKKRTTVTELRIDYNDGSYFTLRAPEGMPSPSFPGYLDCLLFSGQRSLHTQEYVQMSVYEIFKTLKIDPKSGKNYENFRHDMHKAFVIELIPIKSSTARGEGAPGSCAGHRRAPSRDRAHPASTSGSG